MKSNLSPSFKWLAAFAGVVLGMALNGLALMLLGPYLSASEDLWVVAIFGGGGICGGLAYVYVERILEGLR